MKKVCTFLFIQAMFLYVAEIYGQGTFFCATPDEPPQSLIPDPACVNNTNEANLELYKPTSNDPVKTIRMNFHIMQRTGADPQNFEEQNQDHTDYLNQIVAEANSRYSNVGEPLWGGPVPYPNGETHIEDSRIRLELTGIYYWQDSVGWSNNGSICGQYAFNTYAVNPDCELNVFLFGHDNFIGNAGGCAVGRRMVNIRNVFADYLAYTSK